MHKVRMDPNMLTVGDMELFEDLTGLDLMEVLKPTPVIDEETGMPVPDPDPEKRGRPLMTFKVSSKAFRALLFIALKKADPDLTIEQFRGFKISEFDFDLEENSPNQEDGEQKEMPDE